MIWIILFNTDLLWYLFKYILNFFNHSVRLWKIINVIISIELYYNITFFKQNLTDKIKIMVKKRKSVLKSSAQVVDSPMKEPRIISNHTNNVIALQIIQIHFFFLGGNHLEKARNSLNEALDVIAKKEQKKAELATENDVINL